LKSTWIYHCPQGSNHDPKIKPNDSGYTDYWYNARLNGLESKAIILHGSTVMLGDGNDGTDATNARYSLSALPATWRTDSNSPAMRHLEGANYAFADGHVKWFKPEKISGQTPKPHIATFAVR
jgi:prepilin-type processing-associated H-X9-DG protein